MLHESRSVVEDLAPRIQRAADFIGAQLQTKLDIPDVFRLDGIAYRVELRAIRQRLIERARDVEGRIHHAEVRVGVFDGDMISIEFCNCAVTYLADLGRGLRYTQVFAVSDLEGFHRFCRGIAEIIAAQSEAIATAS